MKSTYQRDPSRRTAAGGSAPEKTPGAPGNRHSLCRPRLAARRRISASRACLAGLLVALSLLPAASAQTTRRVDGIATDRTGTALPRARVEFRDAADRLAAVVETDTQGRFWADLPEGRYRVSATLTGFAPLEDRIVEVTGRTPPVKLTLEIASIVEQIVVTATRTETVLPQVGSGTAVVSGAELLTQGAISAADTLRRTPAAYVARSGGEGQLTSLFLRGGESDYTKVLVDGIPVNKPGGSFNFADLSAAGIDRIEIVRGPQSALFGSDAISGVVQVISKRARNEGLSPNPRLSFEGGSFKTFRWAAGLEGGSKRVDYAASFTRFDTDNNVINGSFNHETVAVNLGVRLDDASEVRTVFRSEAGRAGVPGPWAFQRPDPDEFYRSRDLAGGVTFSHRTTRIWTQSFRYAVADSHQLSEDPADSGSYVPSYGGRTAPFVSYDFPFRTVNNTRRHLLGYQADVALRGGHMLTLGGDWERETGIIGDPTFGPLTAERTNYGGFVQDQWALRDRLFVAAGARLEHNQSFGSYAAPRLSLALLARRPASGSFWGSTRIKGNFGLGIKAPTLVESYSRSPYFRGNPNLRAEKATSFDAGVEQQYGRGSLEVVYFDSRFKDQIAYSVTDPVTYAGSFFNVGRSRARGIEAALRQELHPQWEVAGTYTYLDSKVLENPSFDPAFEPGRPLFRRPRHTGFVELRWKPGRWLFSADTLLVGPRPDSDFTGLGLTRNPGYAVLNVTAGLRLSEEMLLFAAFHNVLDKRYMEVLGYPALRSSFRIGLRMN